MAVAVFYPDGVLEGELKEAGIPIFSLAKRGRWDVVGFVLRLIRMVRCYRPDVLHSYISNLVTVVVQPFLASTKIVWGCGVPTWISAGMIGSFVSVTGWRAGCLTRLI